MTIEKEYEDFVRKAFKYSLGRTIKKGDDPAGLAAATFFSKSNIANAKVGAGYAIRIFVKDIFETKQLQHKEITRLDKFNNDLDQLSTLSDIHDLIKDFEISVVDKYYDTSNGKMTLK